ncbi:Uncharacterized protein BWINRASL_04855 [Bacillus mycoides]|nr:hypothetical protein IEQ_04710 [Bacillus cereus BAG6X1-2]SCM98400.1 Uncharacterized protein BWINRASL_04855 [Bacillus mycoides]
MMKEPVNEASYFLCRKTYNNMIEKLTKALQRMRDAFAAGLGINSKINLQSITDLLSTKSKEAYLYNEKVVRYMLKL